MLNSKHRLPRGQFESVCSPLCCNQMVHTLITLLPLKSYDNSTNILIGNMHTWINTNGDA
jgi:hypothetical protein